MKKRSAGAAMRPVIDSPVGAMRTYTLSDAKGVKVVISVRADLADDAIITAALDLLAIPPYRALGVCRP